MKLNPSDRKYFGFALRREDGKFEFILSVQSDGIWLSSNRRSCHKVVETSESLSASAGDPDIHFHG
jgi:hypothetical protein